MPLHIISEYKQWHIKQTVQTACDDVMGNIVYIAADECLRMRFINV